MHRSAARLRLATRLGTAVALLVLAAVPIAGLGASAAAAPVGATARTDDAGSSTTVTQTNPAYYAYEPATGTLSNLAPTVTVDQTQNLTNQVVHVTWSNFTPSRTESGNPGYAANYTFYAVGVYECKGTAPMTSPYEDVKNETETDCYHFTSQEAGTDGLGNAVDTFTAADGTGEAYLQVETIDENSFLGCDAADPCSIVVVPEFGGPITDQYSAKKCVVHKQDTKGSDTALDGNLGDGCSWQDRLTVPLSFAPSLSACPSTAVSFSTGGSPMLARAMAQWRPSWCLATDPLTFGYNSGLNEYEARQTFVSPVAGLANPLVAALTTQPATPQQAQQRAFTYAPLANTSIAITFLVDDDVTGKQVTDLKLDARLVAKLLTQSYSLRYNDCATPAVESETCDPAVLGNPQTILQDPEFRALNPDWADWAQGTGSTMQLGTFLPTVLSGDSDLTYELTRWIASDPAAASFLAGAKDPYGMHINTNYKNPDWPTSQLQVMDPGYTAAASSDGSNGFCAGNGTMQVAWGPVSGLSTVGYTLLANQSTAQDTTFNVGPPCSYSKVGPEANGSRFLLAIMDEGQAQAFQLPTAQLENAAGDFVAPTQASVTAAVAGMSTNADGITQQVDFAAKNATAYPLAVTDYAMVPTCGLSTALAGSVNSMLGLATGSTGQTLGLTAGTLNPGFAPLTATQLSATHKAEGEVSAQKICLKPASVTQVLGTSQTQGSTGGTGVTTPADGDLPGGDGPGGTASGTGAAAAGSPAAQAAAASAATQQQAAAAAGSRTVAYGRKYGGDDTRPAFLLPALLVGAALLLLGAPGAYLLAAGEGAPAWLRRLRIRRPGA